MPNDRSQYQHDIVRQSEEEEKRLHIEKARIDRELEELQTRRLRAQSLPDDPDVCLSCWISDGVHRKMLPQPSGRGADVFRCGTCGNIEERRA